MLSDSIHPFREILKGLSIRQIEDKKDIMSTSEEHRNKRAEPFLTSGVSKKEGPLTVFNNFWNNLADRAEVTIRERE
jgi:hypothetical protein